MDDRKELFAAVSVASAANLPDGSSDGYDKLLDFVKRHAARCNMYSEAPHSKCEAHGAD